LQESKSSESALKPNGDLPAHTKLTTNENAFSANQTMPDHEKEDDQPAGEKGEAEHEIPSGIDETNMDDTAAPTDTEMPDAAPDHAPDQTTSEGLSPKSHPKQESAAKPDEASDEKDPTANATARTTSSPVLGTKEDVAMADTEEQAETPAVMDHTAESTQETVVTDATPVEAKDGSAKAAADSLNGPVDATAGTPPPATPADTSMSEAAQPSAKVSRERDIDSEDEPVAKRTKVGHAEEEVQVQTGAPQDRMDVDQQAGAAKASPYLAGGEPKKLDDDSLNDSPITEWQNKQIRQVLAGVKKTKVGMSFRLPVQQLWPGLWAEYSAKISNPTDISTMEKRLRGDAPRYATMGEFKKDLDLMVQNAVTFNGEGHDVTLQAKACRDAILARMALQTAVEPPKPERKESAKAHTTRHVESRATAPPLNTAAGARPSKGAAASPSQKPAVPESPAFALPPGSNGVPLIRRDSTKPDSRAKRPVKPAHPKDLVYDTKRKKKLPLELRFCDEVLTELRKTKHYDINAAFMQPVDPVALNIPSYHKIIKKPMDLQTMLTKLNSGEYTSAKEFEKDFDLIIKNCRTFNGEDHIVYAQALRLQDLYRAEMSKKDEWMAKHAPVSAAAASHASGLRDDSESEDADSEADPEQDEERKRTENRMATLQKRIDQEQKKVNDMVTSGTADIADVEIAQSVVAMLQKQFMTERAKLAALPAKKAGKPKPAKHKKAGGASALPAKKATAGVSGAAAKKAGPKKPAKKKIGPMEKEIIIDSLGNLDGEFLERAIDLIKKDTGQDENDAGELELDIEILSEDVLVKLYEIALKANPNALAEKQRQHGLPAPPSSDPPAAARPKQPSKSKKNKPMSKTEQERRIQQLNELRAQAVRQASGSQEPMESIEGNGTEPTAQAEHESEDEVDSEED
jgi:bromodomain-containing factor 1